MLAKAKGKGKSRPTQPLLLTEATQRQKKQGRQPLLLTMLAKAKGEATFAFGYAMQRQKATQLMPGAHQQAGRIVSGQPAGVGRLLPLQAKKKCAQGTRAKYATFVLIFSPPLYGGG